MILTVQQSLILVAVFTLGTFLTRVLPFILFPHKYGIPEGIAIAGIVLLHLWKNNVLLSIGGGTLIYMTLVQLVFV